ncbi:MAG: hypothetical protein ACJASQ_001158 [Crocinitomicaceae bacterium]|jgi:hypothetical protein
MRKIVSSNTLLIFAGLVIGMNSFGQAPPIEWQKSFGGSHLDEVGSIRQTSDGGYIMAGETSSSDNDISANNGLHDFWLVKIDWNGVLSWEKSFGGTQMEKAHAVEETADGGFIIAGESASNDGDLTINNGASDFWIVKVSSTGNLIWEKSFGGSNWDAAQSIQQTDDGGYIVAGESESIDGDVTGNHGDMDFWIMKLDSIGNLTWEKSLGGSSWDSAESIQQTEDGGFIVTGSSESNDGDLTLNQGGKDYWVVKLDTNGLIEWQRTVGGSDWDTSHSIQQTADGGYIIAGESRSDDGDVGGLVSDDTNPYGKHGGNRDYWIVKLDSVGLISWQKLYGGTGWDAGQSVQETSDQGYIISGYSDSEDFDVTGNNGNWDYWILKLTYTGDIVWQKSLGGSYHDFGASVRVTNDGGYIVAGSSWSYDNDVSVNFGSNDIWVIKLNPILGVEELTDGGKKRVKILNFMGQETEYKPNTPLIFIYSDGSRERVMKIEE